MDEPSHVQGVLLVAAGLVRAGASVTVFTHRRHAAAVRAVGAEPADLFAGATVEEVDPDSRPVPVRFVTFAAAQAAAVAERVAALGATLVVHDTFATIGSVVARHLGLPAVNLSGGHALVPSTYAARLAQDPRVAVSAACEAAVERLRDEHGIADASPFLYVTATSPVLNLYPEPEEWLAPGERAAFAPIAHVGSLPAGPDRLPREPRPVPEGPVRVHVALGTTVWRYFEDQALAVLEAVAGAGGGRPLSVTVGLGGHDPGPAVLARLRGSGAVVELFDDQRARLRSSDLFVTHHGLRSTHEAVDAGVPMLSVPFFWDQPDLARRCADLGLAVPVSPDAATEPPDAGDVAAAVESALAGWEGHQASLAEARSWEDRVLAGRDGVLRDVLALAGEPSRAR
jgi:UDP:flavonoid glycosyltransferase YjiC (YdhE family)